MKDFTGVKIALFFEGKLVVFLRDNKPGLRFANMWDLPGGGREGDETPLECVTREVEEEFSIELRSDSVVWTKAHPAMHDPNLTGYFMVANVTKEDVYGIMFSTEGQRWTLMTTGEFLAREDVVPHLKTRLKAYLESVGATI